MNKGHIETPRVILNVKGQIESDPYYMGRRQYNVFFLTFVCLWRYSKWRPRLGLGGALLAARPCQNLPG